MINQKLALEIYLEYCREFITNPEGASGLVTRD